jgi:hypothetical protein
MRQTRNPGLTLRHSLKNKGILCAMAATLLLAARDAAAGPVIMSHGQFVDSSGSSNVWTVNAAHTLIWNDKPFVPVGGRFQAKSWSATATDEDWESDKAALVTLKAQGVTDIYIQPAQGGLTSVSPTSIQRLVDYLDKEVLPTASPFPMRPAKR